MGPVEVNEEEIKVLDAHFGVFTIDDFKASSVIELKEGLKYGWLIKLNTSKEVKVTEEFILPVKPRIFDVSNAGDGLSDYKFYDNGKRLVLK